MSKSQTSPTMSSLMEHSGNLPIQQLRRGDVVEGTIIEINQKEALVDVGAKSEGVIPQPELKNGEYKVGDSVLVYVHTPEDRRGQMIVSLSRAEMIRSWIDLQEALKKGTTLDFVITGHNRGGLIGDVETLPGFVPFSHTNSASDLSLEKDDLHSVLDKMIGEKLRVRIIELDREKNRIILSEKEAVAGEELEKRRERVSDTKVGDLITGKVSAVMPYGLMLNVDGLEGLVPREEVTWDTEGIDEALGSFEMGQEVQAQVIAVDLELGKVKLSMKNVSSNPWENVAESNSIGDTVKVAVTRITSFGVFATLDVVEGMIPLSSIPADQELEVGAIISVRIEALDPQKRRLDLSFIA